MHRRDHRLERVELELPASADSVTTRSFPMTRYATMLVTSGMTGFTLPGMIDEPGCVGGQVDLVQAAARTGRQQPQVVADLGELDREALQHRRVEHERLRVLRRLDEVARQLDRHPGDLRQMRRRTSARIPSGALRPVPIAVPPMLISHSTFSMFCSAVISSLERLGERVELLAERHRHGILQLRPSHLEDVARTPSPFARNAAISSLNASTISRLPSAMPMCIDVG